MANNVNDIPMGWDDEIVNDGEGFRLLPKGEYDFTVDSFERKRYDGEKMKACPMAELSITIHDKDGDITITENLFLNRKMEWKLCQFFTAIGARKHGEPLRMNWNIVKGAKGRCKVIIDTYISKKDGKERENNKISEFLDPSEYAAPVQPQGDAAYTQPPLTAPPRKWTGGQF